MRAGGLVALAALLAGFALVGLAVWQGRAELTLVLIVPVVSGSSPEFLAGVLLVILGFFGLVASWWLGAKPAGLPPAGTSTFDVGSGSGGVILLGPVPLFFGSWKGVSRRTRWILALVGAAILVLFVLAVYGTVP
jgi:uncharacterized membrane protein